LWTTRISEELPVEPKNGFDSSQPRSFAPYLVTTIAMVFGMFPIALAGAGAEWKKRLAWVIIGGLISSLFLTLIIVPVIYEIMENDL
jgi:HAE1 family hydrophobic/amphiphilic exporter-1